jgi:hypothetical protein
MRYSPHFLSPNSWKSTNTYRQMWDVRDAFTCFRIMLHSNKRLLSHALLSCLDEHKPIDGKGTSVLTEVLCHEAYGGAETVP